MAEAIRIFSTKKLREPFATAVRDRADITWEEADFITVSPVPFGLPSTQDDSSIHGPAAIAFTSAHGVNFLAAACPGGKLPEGEIFCLEGATLDAAMEASGATRIAGTAHDAASLAECIISRGTVQRVHFYCGNIRRDTLPALLREARIDVVETIVYDTVLTPSPMVARPDAVLFFSPSAVDSFFSINQLSDSVACFAIGATTAAELRGRRPQNPVVAAPWPATGAVLDTLFNYFQLPLLEHAP